MKRIILCALLVTAGLLSTSEQTFADVGASNPYGVSGQYNGNITTGCSYDPFTANATRSVTDIAVSGVVGTYPLAFTRTMNSRAGNNITPAFGLSGTWTHNYQWSINTISHTTNLSNWKPTSCVVNFPDGRMVNFTSQGTDPYWHGVAGVRERFETDNFTSNCYLHLPDGGKVWFQTNLDIEDTTPDGYVIYTYSFAFMGLVDPYGQVTAVTYPADGSMTLTEPAGRMLKVFYKTGPANDTVVQKVEEWMTSSLKGRTITYDYSKYVSGSTTYSALKSVSYPDALTATYTYQDSNTGAGGRPLLKTAVDPMYGGPMWKIAYTFVTTSPQAYGQIQSENYFDGTTVGAAVSSLTVTGTNTRTETRGDGPTRTFTYTGYNMTSGTDFKGINASKAYDANGFIASVTDRNGNATNYTNNAWTGGVTTTTYPLTASDTALGLGRATTQTVFGSASCPDVNNRDANNPYFVYTYTNKTKQGQIARQRAVRGKIGGKKALKRGLQATYLRDTSKRVTTINYPDGGLETFTYNSFGQILTHRLRAGGLETYTYDSRGRRTEYRDAYHLSTADPQNPSVPTNTIPSLAYAYDFLDRVQTVTDAKSNVTSLTYNNRGQVLTTTPPGVAHAVTSTYNSNGTLASVTNEIQKETSYTYDDYKRLAGVTLPPPIPGPSPNPTSYVYDHTGGTNAADYTHTDPNPTRITSATGKIIKIAYDNDHLTSSKTAGYGTSDAATTSFTYDNNGNLKKVTSPNGNIVQDYYDQQNRLTDLDDPMVNDPTTPHKNSNGHTISYTYDQGTDVLTVRRANNQLTSKTYDSMGRLTQVSVPQTPSPTAVTKYVWAPTGLLQSMQDPMLVATSSAYKYAYSYDLMGRKAQTAYPPGALVGATTENWTYDTSGNIATFVNRNGQTQTFSFDSRNRETGFTWSDGLTPDATITYDDASRMTGVTNANAAITRSYYDDNTPNTETSLYADGVPRTVTYASNADGTRATLQYPNAAYGFTYSYTNRNQLKTLANASGGAVVSSYIYDLDGNLTNRSMENATSSLFSYDSMDRVTHIAHALSGTTRTLDYGYDAVNNRKWTKRDASLGDVFGYDSSDEVDATQLNITNPDTTPPGSSAGILINYDANGNRKTLANNGLTDTYTTDALNQYGSRNSSSATYDSQGNTTTGLDGAHNSYDARNRLLSSTKGSNTETFAYDGFGRQISRVIGGASPLYNVYDNWDLIAEYQPGGTAPQTAYVSAAGGMVKLMTASGAFYYYQDASSSTSHLASGTGSLVEAYRYDLQGTPVILNASGTQISSSAYGIRHLFTGQQWYADIGLYDLRNRFYSPDTGRFLQADPIGFSGDATNLYRYCSNNPLIHSDPLGLLDGEMGDDVYYADGGSGGGDGWDAGSSDASESESVDNSGSSGSDDNAGAGNSENDGSVDQCSTADGPSETDDNPPDNPDPVDSDPQAPPATASATPSQTPSPSPAPYPFGPWPDRYFNTPTPWPDPTPPPDPNIPVISAAPSPSDYAPFPESDFDHSHEDIDENAGFRARGVREFVPEFPEWEIDID